MGGGGGEAERDWERGRSEGLRDCVCVCVGLCVEGWGLGAV